MEDKRMKKSLNLYIGLKRMNFDIECLIRDDVKKYGLSINEFGVLEALYHKGEQTTQEIKNKILVSNSSTTYIIDQLCKRNLVVRVQDNSDRRIIYIHLTEEGRELIKNSFPKHSKVIKDYFKNLSDEDLEFFHQCIKRITNYKKNN